MRIGISRLDIKLGFRNLVKHPLLAVVGGVSIIVAVVLAAAWFEFSWDLNNPALPFEDSDRIVAIRNADLAEAGMQPPSLHEFDAWRGELQSIVGLSAVRPFEFTISTDDRRSRTSGALVTASTFQLLRVTPILGRPLGAADMEPGAPAVVIGYDLWQRLFAGDSSVIGRTIEVGTAPHTVVGVMPDGFAFPANAEFWVPLRADAREFEPGESPAVLVFGRLAPGFTQEEAQAELTAVGRRMAAEFPAMNEHLRARVGPLVDLGWQTTFSAAVNLVFILLLVVICANVATLSFARTARREGELAVRSALGASRGRLVAQLIAEALVLTLVAAGIGLAIAAWGIPRGMDLFFQVQQSTPPYWWDTAMSMATVGYVLGLAVLAAMIIGGLPALRATGRRARPALSRLGSGGTALKFGRLATAVIVVQVALCVIFIPLVISQGQAALEGARITSATRGFAADEFLSGRLSRDTEVPAGALPDSAREAFSARTTELQADVRRRLAAMPGVSAVTFYGRLAGFNHPESRIRFKNEVVASDSAAELHARALAVDLDFFDVTNTRLVSGRTFRAADLESEVGVAVVSQRFVDTVLNGRSAIGRRFRYPGRDAEGAKRWYRIIGVIQDPALISSSPGTYVGVYHPLAPGDQASVRFLLHASPNPETLVPRVGSLIASVDPSLVVEDLMPLDEIWKPVRRADVFFATAFGVVVTIVVLLALAGIYALTSFTVAQRTREIGIRVAVGASPRRVIAAILSRAVAQIGTGVLVGALVAGYALADSENGVALVAGVAALMMVMGLLACVLPARRALRIQPTEALKAEG